MKRRTDGSEVVMELPIPESLLAQGASYLAAELKKVKGML
jgi:hypothetical protein